MAGTDPGKIKTYRQSKRSGAKSQVLHTERSLSVTHTHTYALTLHHYTDLTDKSHTSGEVSFSLCRDRLGGGGGGGGGSGWGRGASERRGCT